MSKIAFFYGNNSFLWYVEPVPQEYRLAGPNNIFALSK